ADARKRYQEAQEDLQRAEAQALEREKHTLQEILTDLAKERGANIVIDKSVVLLLDTRLEVTEEAMRRLDEKLPSMTVNFSPGKPPAPAPAAAGTPAGKPPPPKKKS